tara:strand:- start:117 stop:431 length:315 start_codon:yes stop_codon:yes gene_type:complete
MKVIEQVIFTDNLNDAVPDLSIERWFREIMNSKKSIIYLSTDLQLSRLRLGTKEKVISSFFITFNLKRQENNNNKYHVDSNGKIKEQFPDELSVIDTILSKLVF